MSQIVTQNEKVIKSYTIEWIEFNDESGQTKSLLRRTCRGFTSYELLGIVIMLREEISDQIKGKIKPDVIERRVIQENGLR